MNEVAKKLMDIHNVELPGAVLLAIMDKMMNEIVDGMEREKAAAKKGLNNSILEEIEKNLNADYTIGLVIFAEARKVFGDQFIDDYCEGKDVIPPPPAVGSSSATH